MANWLGALEGFDRQVLTNLERSDFNEEVRRMGVRLSVGRWTHGGGGRRALRDVPACCVDLLRVTKGRRHLVHVNDIQTLLRFGPAATALRLPTVFNVRSTKAPNEPYGLTWRLAARTVERWLVLSNNMRDTLVSRINVLRPQRVEAIPSIVDPARIGPGSRDAAREELGLPRKRPIVVYPANFTQRKGQERLIREGVPELLRRQPDALVCLLGDCSGADPYQASCLAALGQAPSEVRRAIQLPGFQKDMSPWYRAADVVLVASRREGLCRTMIEAISCSVPVASFDVTSAQEVLGRGAGAVVPIGDYPALMEAVSHLIESPPAEETLLEAAAPYRPEAVHQKLRAFYSESLRLL